MFGQLRNINAAANSSRVPPLTGHGKPLDSNTTSPRADPRAPAPFLSQAPASQPYQASQAPEPSQAPPAFNAIRMPPLPEFSQMGGESYDRRAYLEEDYENHLKAGGIDEDWEPTSYQPQTYRPSPRTTPEPDSQYQQDSFQESQFPDPLSIPSTPVRMTQTQPATLLAPEEIGDSQSQFVQSTQAEVEAQLLGALQSPRSEAARSSDTASVVTAIYAPQGASVLGKRPSLPGEEAPGPADRAYVDLLQDTLGLAPRGSPRKDGSAQRKKVKRNARTQTPPSMFPEGLAIPSSAVLMTTDKGKAVEDFPATSSKGKGKAVDDFPATSSIPCDPEKRAYRLKCMADGTRVHRELSSSPVKGTPADQRKSDAPTPALEIPDTEDEEFVTPVKTKKKAASSSKKKAASSSKKKAVGSSKKEVVESNVEDWIKSAADVGDFLGIPPKKVEERALACTPAPQLTVEEFLATGAKSKPRPFSPLSKRTYPPPIF